MTPLFCTVTRRSHGVVDEILLTRQHRAKGVNLDLVAKEAMKPQRIEGASAHQPVEGTDHALVAVVDLLTADANLPSLVVTELQYALVQGEGAAIA